MNQATFRGNPSYEKRSFAGFLVKHQNRIVEIISGLLIFLFLYTGLSKLVQHDTFKFNLTESPLLSSFAGFLSIALPIGEILLVGLLLFKRTQLKGLWISVGLLSLFTIYLIYMVSFHDKLPCSCGGVISKMSWKQHIPFNLLFVALSLLAIYFLKKQNGENEKKPDTVFT
jgi:hypothetical protein